MSRTPEKPEVVFVENPREIKAIQIIGAPEAHGKKPEEDDEK